MLEGLLPLLPHKNSFIHHTCVFLKQDLKHTIIMKTKLLFLFLSVMLLQVNMSVSAMVMKDGHRILLKDIKASGSHRSMPVLPAAFIDGSLLSVDFLYSVGSATITVKNSETGEIVYSSTDLNVTTLQIDLTGEAAGEYSLEISIGNSILSGDFILEY